MRFFNEGSLSSSTVQRVVHRYGTPAYIYDESALRSRCRELVLLKHTHSINVRYAMKANSSAAILQIVTDEGLDIDASSPEEVERAILAGIDPSRILLTSQQVPTERTLAFLEEKLQDGLLFNACSLGQLRAVAPLVQGGRFPLYIRIHPGTGSGESSTRNTGSNYSCFGVCTKDLEEVTDIVEKNSILVRGVHIHIGSGSDSAVWLDTVSKGVTFVQRHFPEVEVLNLGGGFKTARMPDEITADVSSMVAHACEVLDQFAVETGRHLKLEIEPGTFVAASAGYLATRVMELKSTGESGYEFVLLDSGMEANTRPLLYGARHPFFVFRGKGEIVHSDFNPDPERGKTTEAVVVGKCCETGDSQTIDSAGEIAPRKFSLPRPGDTFLIGGSGAYCSSMAPSGYNSSLQLREVLVRPDGSSFVIRRPQTMNQLIENEEHLPEFVSNKEVL